MRVKAALKSHCSTAQGVLQTLDCAVVAGIGGMLLVVAHQALKLVFAYIECAGKIECDIGRVVRAALAVFIRPIAELPPLVSAFFRQLDHTLLHKPTFLHIFVVSLQVLPGLRHCGTAYLQTACTSRASPAFG